MKLFWNAVKVMKQARPSTTCISDKQIKDFELRWRKKMIHARLNAFLRGFYNRRSKEEGFATQGGFTLRDDLYAVAKDVRRKRKNSK